MTDDWLVQLIDDVEEELEAFGIVGLWDFTWWQSIGSRPDERELIIRRAHEAYGEFRRRHPEAWLGWITWPGMTPEAARPADPDTEPNFLLDPDAPAGSELLVLVEG